MENVTKNQRKNLELWTMNLTRMMKKVKVKRKNYK